MQWRDWDSDENRVLTGGLCLTPLALVSDSKHVWLFQVHSCTPVHSSSPPRPFQALSLFSSSTAPGPQLTGMQVPPASHARQSSLKIQAGHQPVGTSTGSPGVIVSVKPRYTWEDGISHYLNQNGLWARGGGGISLIDN